MGLHSGFFFLCAWAKRFVLDLVKASLGYNVEYWIGGYGCTIRVNRNWDLDHVSLLLSFSLASPKTPSHLCFD
jgi:hypothetical protein